jgi:hypothetical protein
MGSTETEPRFACEQAENREFIGLFSACDRPNPPGPAPKGWRVDSWHVDIEKYEIRAIAHH